MLQGGPVCILRPTQFTSAFYTKAWRDKVYWIPSTSQILPGRPRPTASEGQTNFFVAHAFSVIFRDTVRGSLGGFSSLCRYLQLQALFLSSWTFTETSTFPTFLNSTNGTSLCIVDSSLCLSTELGDSKPINLHTFVKQTGSDTFHGFKLSGGCEFYSKSLSFLESLDKVFLCFSGLSLSCLRAHVFLTCSGDTNLAPLTPYYHDAFPISFDYLT